MGTSFLNTRTKTYLLAFTTSLPWGVDLGGLKLSRRNTYLRERAILTPYLSQATDKILTKMADVWLPMIVSRDNYGANTFSNTQTELFLTAFKTFLPWGVSCDKHVASRRLFNSSIVFELVKKNAHFLNSTTK
jgi:hypothetical protein